MQRKQPKNHIMNKRAIIAAIAGAVAFFLLGWLLFGVLLMNLYVQNTTEYTGLMKEMPNLWILFISNLASGLLLAFIFQNWASISTFKGGLTGGLIIGFLLGIIIDGYFLSGFNLYSAKVIIVDVLANTFLYGIIGGLIGWILGYRKKATT